MNIRKVLLKKSLVVTLSVAVCAAAGATTIATTLCAPTPDITYPSADQAIVYTDAGLHTAITNPAVSTITFGNDITVTRTDMVIAYNRANPDLVIDGAGYTLTEYYVSTYNYCDAIHMDCKGKVNSITLENMNINGENAYGTISISDCACGVTMSYRNITYTGPQLTYDANGPVIYDNCSIHIAYAKNGTKTGATLQEVGEVKSVEFRGNVTILKDPDTDGCAEEIFWLRTCTGAVTVDPGANVNVTYNNKGVCCSGGFVYSCGCYPFTVGQGATFSYSGYRDFWKCCAMNSLTVADDATFNVSLQKDQYCYECIPAVEVCGNVTVGNTATFKVTTDGDMAYSALQVSGNLTTNPGAVFRLVQTNNNGSCACGTTLCMSGCTPNVTFNRPGNLLIYNGNDKNCCAKAVGNCCLMNLTFTGSQYSYWYNAASSQGPDVLANPAITWNNSPLSTYTANAKFDCCGNVSSLTNTGYQGATAMTKANFALACVKIVSAGSQTIQTSDINGAVTWADFDNANRTRPPYVTVTLMQNGVAFKTVQTTAAEGWAYSFQNVPATDNSGNLYVYTLTEDNLPSTYTYTVSADFTIINNQLI